MKRIKTDSYYFTQRTENVKRYFNDVQCKTHKINFNDDESNISKEELINRNLRFAIAIAKKYIHQGVPFEDLIQVANIGLIESVKSYDPKMGFKFISYAVWRIKRNILNVINENRLGIKSNYRATSVIPKYLGVINKYSQELGRLMSLEDVQCYDPDAIPNLVAYAIKADRSTHMEDPLFGNWNSVEGDINILDCYGQNPEIEKKIEDDNLKSHIQEMMNKLLSKDEREILIEIFYNNETLETIASKLKLSREAIRQRYYKAIKKLKRHREYLLQ